MSVVFAGALFVELSIAVLGSGLSAIDTQGPITTEAGFGSPERMGELLLTKFLLPFEAASFLLLIAAVGAVVLARRRGGLSDDADAEGPPQRLQRRAPGVESGTMAEAVTRRSTCPAARPGSRRAGEHRLVPHGLGREIFCIGAAGVLARRNPLVVLLCLELMLNAANLALIGFSRMWGNSEGQVFAVIVMVVAACEVCIGLGMVVAIYRRRLPIDVDELRELQG